MALDVVIDGLSRRYSELATNGLSVWQLKGKYEEGYHWSCIIEKSPFLTAETAKKMATDFLYQEYRAYDISFTRRAEWPDDRFKVSFKRGV